MKKTFKIASVILALAMIFSVFGVAAFAAESSDVLGNKLVATISGNTVSGSFNTYGWFKDVKVYEGSTPSGAAVGTYTAQAGTYPTSGNYSITVPNSTKGFCVALSTTTADNVVTVVLPYSGPLYKMEIQRNGSKIDNVTVGINEGAASGFKFVYEAGHNYTYKISDTSVFDITKSGDNFTINAKKAGTATLTAECDGTNPQTLTVTVNDDSSLSAFWYATQSNITNGAKFEANCGKSYGIGVEAFPAGAVNVTLQNNTAGAEITTSSVEGQYPYAIKGTTAGGSATVVITGKTKTISFTVNFTEAAFDFFMDANYNEIAEPLVDVPVNSTVTVYANKAVKTWDVSNKNNISVVTGSNSIAITGKTVDTFTTITAKDANGEVLQWFDVYVTGAATGPQIPDIIKDCIFTVSKADSRIALQHFFGEDEVKELESETLIVDNVALVPLRVLKDQLFVGIDWIEETKQIVAHYTGYHVTMTLGETYYEVAADGIDFVFASGNLSAAPTILGDNKTYLPLRDVTGFGEFDEETGRLIKYVENSYGKYIVFVIDGRDNIAKSDAQINAMVDYARGFIG